MVEEAPLRRTDSWLVPEGEGWFVVNAREARWLDDGPLGVYTPFAGEARFPRIGINLAVLEPGQPSSMYHGEDEQEDFLILAGECLLLIEEQERSLRAWDFVHCPPGTRHTFVGIGEDPCVIFMTGARSEGGTIVYPVSETARAHGAGVDAETPRPSEAYAPFPHWRLGRPDAWPGLPWS